MSQARLLCNVELLKLRAKLGPSQDAVGNLARLLVHGIVPELVFEDHSLEFLFPLQLLNQLFLDITVAHPIFLNVCFMDGLIGAKHSIRGLVLRPNPLGRCSLLTLLVIFFICVVFVSDIKAFVVVFLQLLLHLLKALIGLLDFASDRRILVEDLLGEVV